MISQGAERGWSPASSNLTDCCRNDSDHADCSPAHRNGDIAERHIEGRQDRAGQRASEDGRDEWRCRYRGLQRLPRIAVQVRVSCLQPGHRPGMLRQFKQKTSSTMGARKMPVQGTAVHLLHRCFVAMRGSVPHKV